MKYITRGWVTFLFGKFYLIFVVLNIITIFLTSGSYSHVIFTLNANFSIGSPSSFNDDTLTLGKDTVVLEPVFGSPIFK